MTACHVDVRVNTFPDRSPQGLFYFLEDLPLFDVRFTADQGPGSAVTC